MAVDGNWNITLSTPLGDRDATLTLKTDGTSLTASRRLTATKPTSSTAA